MRMRPSFQCIAAWRPALVAGCLAALLTGCKPPQRESIAATTSIVVSVRKGGASAEYRLADIRHRVGVREVWKSTSGWTRVWTIRDDRLPRLRRRLDSLERTVTYTIVEPGTLYTLLPEEATADQAALLSEQSGSEGSSVAFAMDQRRLFERLFQAYRWPRRSEGESVLLPLPTGVKLKLEVVSVRTGPADIYTISLRSPDRTTVGTITAGETGLLGSVDYRGQVLALLPVGNGFHEVTFGKSIFATDPDHPRELAAGGMPADPQKSDAVAAAADLAADRECTAEVVPVAEPVNIRVAFGYSLGAEKFMKRKFGTRLAGIDIPIDWAGVGQNLAKAASGTFERSGAPNVTLESVGTVATEFDEIDFRRRARKPGKHYFELLYEELRKEQIANPALDKFFIGARRYFAADVAVLLTGEAETGMNYCGITPVFRSPNAQAFITVRVDCALFNHSFDHELGHLLGARHQRVDCDKGADDAECKLDRADVPNRPPSFNRAFDSENPRSTDRPYGSLMATNKRTAQHAEALRAFYGHRSDLTLHERKPFWSTPDLADPLLSRRDPPPGQGFCCNNLAVVVSRAKCVSKFHDAALIDEKGSGPTDSSNPEDPGPQAVGDLARADLSGLEAIFAFNTGESAVGPEMQDAIESLGKRLAAAGIRKVNIEGHADTRGSEGRNKTLSRERATNVKTRLLAAMDEGAEITTLPFGAENPPVHTAAQSRDAQANARNRVAIVRWEPFPETH